MKNYLKNQIIYQVYVRNFTKEGTFNAFNKYIDYIKDLGTDIIYFMPVNTIGEVNRKGDLGSPYSIKDYYEINPELGTLEDFKNTINLIHSKNMKVMLDIVFNHTSRDSVLLKTHPEWFYKNKEGKLASKAGDWTDVYDLEYTNNPELIDYLCNVIRYYIELGIDGFRFDVASLVSKDFYLTLKNTVLKEYPNTIMLAEAIDAGFTLALRKEGFKVLDDPTLYEVGFDLLYQYNNFDYLRNYLNTGDIDSLNKFKVLKNYENPFNPEGALRIREIENHDQKRIVEYTSYFAKRRNLLAYSFFLDGPMFIYNGLETKADHHLSLFTKDLLDLSIDEEWFNLVKKIITLKKDPCNLNITASEVDTTNGEFIIAKNTYQNGKYIYGIFNFNEKPQLIRSKFLIDGIYKNLLDDKMVIIKDQEVLVKEPMYLRKYED